MSTEMRPPFMLERGHVVFRRLAEKAIECQFHGHINLTEKASRDKKLRTLHPPVSGQT